MKVSTDSIMTVLNAAWNTQGARDAQYEKESARLKRKALSAKKAADTKRKFSVPSLWCNFD